MNTKQPLQTKPLSPAHATPLTIPAAGILPPDIPEVKRGYLIISLFFGALLLWGLLANLPSAAIAPGEVLFDGYRKQVQHLDGGIVDEVFVKEGQAVASGDILLAMDDVSLRTRHDTLRSRLILEMAKSARLEAEAQRRTSIQFPEWLNQRKQLPQVAQAMRHQLDIFDTRRGLSSEKARLLAFKIEQKESQRRGDNSRLRSMKRQLELIGRERESQARLVAEQLVTRSQLYSLQTREQDMQADIAALESGIRQTGSLINQLQAEYNEARINSREQVVLELEATRGTIINLQQELQEATEKLARTEIRAPVSGIVADLKINAAGAVALPGQGLLQIVPDDGELIITARIAAKDRDSVHTGQAAEIRFSAFNQRTHRPIHGEVALISADRVTDPSSLEPYFKANIRLLENPDDVFPPGSIHPGMQAEVLIVTGTRSVMRYLLDPLLGRFNRAMVEE